MTARVIVLDPCFDAADAPTRWSTSASGSAATACTPSTSSTTPTSAAGSRRATTRSRTSSGPAALGARTEPLAALAVRTSYFREEYAYGRDERIAGIAPFLTTRRSSRRPARSTAGAVIEPAIAYANLMVPGQELAVHTDVPEFRGANRKLVPQWLLVVMHHSGLFDEYRMPIATAIAWFHDCDGGELAYWPDGATSRRSATGCAYNTAMVLDTDSRVPRRRPHRRRRRRRPSADPARHHARLRRRSNVVVARGRRQRARALQWDELRFSVSWKAYCFRDEHERDTWRDHRDDLTLDVILDRLVDDLRERGRVDARRRRATASSVCCSSTSTSGSRYPHRRPQVDPLSIHRPRVVRSCA